MPLKEFTGAAPATRLSNSLAVGTTTNFAVITSGGNGYPSGSTAPFVVVIDRGTSLEEKILVGSRAGDTFSDLTRGYDGTTPQAHAAQAIVEHVLDAATIIEVNAHVNDDTRDDHSQYLNSARHAATAHTGAMIQDLSVGTADIADQAVTGPKIEASQRWLPGDFKQGIQTADHSGWLLCDGRAVSIATYSALWAAMGSAHMFGADPGSGNFLLPDLRKKVLMNKAASGVGSTLGASGGSADAVAVTHSHQINNHTHSGTSSDQNQSHAHTLGSHVHGTADGGVHKHGVDGDSPEGIRILITHGLGNDRANNGSGGTQTPYTFSRLDNNGSHNHGNTGGPAGGSDNANQGHSHTLTTGNPSDRATDNGSGTVAATDKNLPPFMAVNGFIHV